MYQLPLLDAGSEKCQLENSVVCNKMLLSGKGEGMEQEDLDQAEIQLQTALMKLFAVSLI